MVARKLVFCSGRHCEVGDCSFIGLQLAFRTIGQSVPKPQPRFDQFPGHWQAPRPVPNGFVAGTLISRRKMPAQFSGL